MVVTMNKNISLEIDNRIAILTVNRPHYRNMLNKNTRLELSSIIDSIQDNSDIGVLVVTGSGNDFFMSGDLEELSKMSSLELYEFLDTLGQRLYTRFEDLDIPVIAAINGQCMGAGLEIAMACDIRVAAKNVLLGLPEVNLGVMPAGGATQRLIRLVGIGKAKELLYTGDPIEADDAFNMGLVNHVVPANELNKTVMELAEKIATKSSMALKMLKRSINITQESSVSAGLSFEMLAAVANWNSPDRQEGIEAFFSKRKPNFNTKQQFKEQ